MAFFHMNVDAINEALRSSSQGPRVLEADLEHPIEKGVCMMYRVVVEGQSDAMTEIVRRGEPTLGEKWNNFILIWPPQVAFRFTP